MGTEVKYPDAKKHKTVSLVKSAIRITSSLAAVCVADLNLAVLILAIGYGFAELVGIYEELV